MEEPFVLHQAGTSRRWTLHRPIDTYGDGYIWTVRAQISDYGMSAVTSAKLDGDGSDLGAFFQLLADGWRGWEGARTWRSLDGEMEIDARHDGRGHVAIGVTLRYGEPSFAADAWSARVVLAVEGGEEMARLASDLWQLRCR
jgi:Family of unknown function (DUF6228)